PILWASTPPSRMISSANFQSTGIARLCCGPFEKIPAFLSHRRDITIEIWGRRRAFGPLVAQAVNFLDGFLKQRSKTDLCKPTRDVREHQADFREAEEQHGSVARMSVTLRCSF